MIHLARHIRAWSSSIAAFTFAAAISACENANKGAASASTSEASASSSAAAANAPGGIPATVDDLAKAIPGDAALVVTVPSLDKLDIPKQSLDMIAGLVNAEIAQRLGVSEATATKVLKSFDGAALFDLSDFKERVPQLAIIARFKDASTGEDLIRDLKLEKTADDRYVLATGGAKLFFAWLPGPHVAIGAPREDALQAALDTLSGKRGAFADTPRAKKADPTRLFAYADLHRLVTNMDEIVAAGSEFTTMIGVKDSQIDLREYGEKIPRLGNFIAPTSHDGLAKLPAGTPLAVDLSLARRPGKTIADLLTEFGRTSGKDATAEADGALDKLAHTSLADLDRALGDDLAFAAYPPATPLTTTDTNELLRKSAGIARLGIRDDKPIRALFDAAKKTLGNAPGFKWSDGKLVADLGGPELIVEVQSDAVIATVGDKAFAEKLLADYKNGASPFGDTEAYKTFKSKSVPSQLTIFTDYDTVMKLMPQAAPGSSLTGIAGTDLVLRESDKGLDLTFQGGGTIFVVGTLSAVGIYGVTRYLVSAKASEAKNTIGAISRGAVGAFERETADPAHAHALCKTAKPTSAAPPSGRKEMADTESGSEDAGWKCLRFSITDPVYYQYEYRQGPPYKCVARGGPDPGPDGFEASAEGDLDGDGKTSLFCLIGKKAGDSIRVSTEMFTVDANE